jgi:hypothetical protein
MGAKRELPSQSCLFCVLRIFWGMMLQMMPVGGTWIELTAVQCSVALPLTPHRRAATGVAATVLAVVLPTHPRVSCFAFAAITAALAGVIVVFDQPAGFAEPFLEIFIIAAITAPVTLVRTAFTTHQQRARTALAVIGIIFITDYKKVTARNRHSYHGLLRAVTFFQANLARLAVGLSSEVLQAPADQGRLHPVLAVVPCVHCFRFAELRRLQRRQLAAKLRHDLEAGLLPEHEEDGGFAVGEDNPRERSIGEWVLDAFEVQHNRSRRGG